MSDDATFAAVFAKARSDGRFWALADALLALEARGGLDVVPAPDVLDARLSARARVRFVASPPRPRRRSRTATAPVVPYDTRIVRDGEVPTRPGSVHDFMNALVWASFPAAKRALHARQKALVVPAARFESQRRPRALDALALVDEGGVLVGATMPLASETDVREALTSGAAVAAVFGHAIYQGIALGWPDPLGSAIVLELPAEVLRGDRTRLVAAFDAGLASVLSDGQRMTDPEALGRVDIGVCRAVPGSP